MFPNLKAEMARQNITAKGMSEGLGLGREAVSNRLKGRNKISTQLAMQIRDTYFPTMTIDYLFSTKKEA